MAKADVVLEEQEELENIAVQFCSLQVGSFQDAVFGNDMLFRKILSYISAPEDIFHIKLVSKYWKDAENNFQDEKSKLTITADESDFLEVRFGTQKLSVSYKTPHVFKTELDTVMEKLPEAMKTVKEIKIKGVRLFVQDRLKHGHDIMLDNSLGDFLDSFKLLKHLVLENVSLCAARMKVLRKSAFIDKLKHLSLLNITDHPDRLKTLVGSKVRDLHVSEVMLRHQKTLVKRLPDENINVVVYIEDPKWPNNFIKRNDQLYDKRNGYTKNITWHVKQMQKYQHLPYYNCFDRNVNLDEEEIPTIRHCEELRTLKMLKCRKDGNDVEINRFISEIAFFPKITQIVIAGFFDEQQFEQLATVLGQCIHLTHVILRMPSDAPNPMVYVRFIGKLPLSLRCLKLDGIVSNAAIYALKKRFAETLMNLEIKFRETQLSLKYLRIITRYFPKLRYLKLDGIEENFSSFRLLKKSRIPRIEVHFELPSTRFFYDCHSLFSNSNGFHWHICQGRMVFKIYKLYLHWYWLIFFSECFSHVDRA